MEPVARIIEGPNLPKPVGAYSTAILHNGILTISGQIAIDRDGKDLCNADIVTQVRCIFQNLRAILGAASTSLDHILDVTVFLSDIRDFGVFNDAYTRELGSHRPTRALMQVCALPKGAKIELKVVAYVDPPDDPA